MSFEVELISLSDLIQELLTLKEMTLLPFKQVSTCANKSLTTHNDFDPRVAYEQKYHMTNLITTNNLHSILSQGMI